VTNAPKQKSAVVLLSGGIDSSTCLAIAKAQGYACYALSFSYGQRHSLELDCARQVATALGVREHLVIDMNLHDFGGSALTAEIEVPKGRSNEEMAEGISVTYVPARNTIFLSFALGWAEVVGADNIFIGVNALDYGGYPDCRPEYIEAFAKLANLATKAGVEGTRQFRFHTPLIHLTKAEIVRRGSELGVNYGLTSSCYDPRPEGACRACDACQLRRQGFADAGFADPTHYRS